ncbi:MAG: hypothetical protein H3C30_10735 [Candidatus Hydrogenedentes bacterium]|nr:hypothetical protein [Candidatus Hydrogenedentota bacterium]
MKRYIKYTWLIAGLVLVNVMWSNPAVGEYDNIKLEITLQTFTEKFREIKNLWHDEQFEASLTLLEELVPQESGKYLLFSQLIYHMKILEFKAVSNVHGSIPAMKNPKSTPYQKRFLDVLEKCFSIEAEMEAADSRLDDRLLYSVVLGAEAMIACGRDGFVCPWLDEIVKKFLDSQKFNAASVDAQKFLLRASFVRQFCGDKKNNTPETRAANMVELARPYVEEPWLAEFLKDFALSNIWRSGLYGLEGQYAYLTAFEPFFKDRPGETADSYYVRLTITARKLQNHEAVIRWCNIVLARRGNTGEGALEYNRILYEAGEALRKERNEPHPHEEDLKMFEELGL